MKTRLGKIAQLPKPIRTQLNHRLENGQQSPELLAWLNALPQTKKLIATKFDNQPITKTNLSHWRHGGYQDWLSDQQRQAHIQRISESGDALEKVETGDLFENFARIAVAELMADFDSLRKLRGEDRSRNLHHLVRDLAHLQNSFNRSRWADLAWTKYNDLDSGTDVSPVRPEQFPEPETRNLRQETRNSEPETRNVTPCPSTSVAPGCTQSQVGTPRDYRGVKPERPRSPSGSDVIYHTKCECGEPCRKCHAPDSDYPLDVALRDKEYHRKHHCHPHDRNGYPKFLMNVECHCFCDRCAEKTTSAPCAEIEPDRDALLAVREDRDPIIRHAQPRGENPSSVAQTFQSAGSGDFPVPGPQLAIQHEISTINPTPPPIVGPSRPTGPTSPMSPASVVLADFNRCMALLKSARR